MRKNKTMEINKAALTVAIALFALPLAFGAMTYKSSSPLERKLASQVPDFDTLVHTMKLDAQASVEITSADVVTTGSNFSLSSKIHIARRLPRTRWEWIVPEGIVATSPTGGFIDAGTVDPVVSIQLRHDSEKNEKVRLRLFSDDNRQIAAGTYNTLEQDRIKENLTALKESQLKYSEENPELRRDDSEPIEGVENY